MKAARDEQAKAKQQFASALRQKSQQLYGQTKRSYGEPVARMDTAAARTDPVPTRCKNRVLFIKGNLNAQAVASLKGTELGLGSDIDKLIKDMEASIAEADRFISQFDARK